jgi:hypothetical protein
MSMNAADITKIEILTSSSHNTLSTFSSKLVSTRLIASLGITDSVSLRSIVIGTLSRHLELDVLPSESELDLGGGDDGLTGKDDKAGAVADS